MYSSLTSIVMLLYIEPQNFLLLPSAFLQPLAISSSLLPPQPVVNFILFLTSVQSLTFRFYVWEHVIFCAWLISCSTITSVPSILLKMILFLLMAEKYSVVYMHHIFYVHWLLDTNCFCNSWLLWIELLINKDVQPSLTDLVIGSHGQFLVFWGTSILFSIRIV